MWPVYFKDQLIVGNPESSVSICALWTIKELVAQNLNKESFAVCGQLYSKEGIRYLFRNILANPRIRFLILCGNDQSGSGKALLETFEKGVSPDPKIPREVFEVLLKNVRIIDKRGEAKSEEIKKIIEGLEQKSEFWTEPQVFEEEMLLQTVAFPTDPSVFKPRHPTVAACWPWILKHIMRFGVEKKTDYGVKEKEILNLAAVIYNEDPKNLGFAPYFTFTAEEFAKYAPQILNPEPIEGVSYTYGERLRNYHGIDQIKEGIIEKLKESINSRRTVACTWDVEKDIKHQQPPCINLVQGLVQNNLFHMTVYIRSNDMFKAWPQNALALRQLQGIIAQEIKTELGGLTTISASAHIYEQDFEKANEIIKKYGSALSCVWDPRGNFVIGLDKEKKEIIASHCSPDGVKIAEYRGKTAQEIYHQLDSDLAVSQISHAFDLGEELYKAEVALKLDKEYRQDNPLFE